MKKLFISQPAGMNGTDRNRERRAAIAKVENFLGEKVIVIEHFQDPNPLWRLSDSIKLLYEADIVCFLDGWEKDRQCVIERECCLRYYIPILLM